MTEPGVRPPYRIETERTLLRCWSPSDAALLRASLDRSDTHLRPWIPFMKDEPRALEETADWLRARLESLYEEFQPGDLVLHKQYQRRTS